MKEPIVLYNGACPVCATGANAYRKATKGDHACEWIDVTREPDVLIAHGVTLKAVRYRIHCVDENGVMLRGVPAMAAIWDKHPHFRWAATLVRFPGLSLIAAGVYEVIAAPLYVWNTWRDREKNRVR